MTEVTPYSYHGTFARKYSQKAVKAFLDAVADRHSLGRTVSQVASERKIKVSDAWGILWENDVANSRNGSNGPMIGTLEVFKEENPSGREGVPDALNASVRVREHA